MNASRILRSLLPCLFLLSIAAASPALAEGGAKPIQIALVDPIQIFNKDTDIHGVRVNVLYGVSRDMMGVDLGLINRTSRDFKGFAWGGLGYVEGEMVGWQNHYLANIVVGRGTGVQSGLYNSSGGFEGLQLGLVNIDKNTTGLQLGFVNMTERMEQGLQIGLINIIQSKEKFPVLPIVNWVF